MTDSRLRGGYRRRDGSRLKDKPLPPVESLESRLAQIGERAFLERAMAVHARVPARIRVVAHDWECGWLSGYTLSKYSRELVTMAERCLIAETARSYGQAAESLGVASEVQRTLPLVFGAFDPAMLAKRRRRGALEEREHGLVRLLMRADSASVNRAASMLAGMHLAYRFLLRPAADAPSAPRLPHRADSPVGGWLREQTYVLMEGGAPPEPWAFVELVESFHSATLVAVRAGESVHFLVSGPGGG